MRNKILIIYEPSVLRSLSREWIASPPCCEASVDPRPLFAPNNEHYPPTAELIVGESCSRFVNESAHGAALLAGSATGGHTSYPITQDYLYGVSDPLMVRMCCLNISIWFLISCISRSILSMLVRNI